MNLYFRGLLLSLVIIIHTSGICQMKLESKNTESILYLGNGKQQPLIVGFGGSEGGNAWSSDYWKGTRDRFIDNGYAFLAVGYFGAPGTPSILDKIELENIYNAIQQAKKNPAINGKKIALIGGSRGADLALLLASYYPEIGCVISIVGSHAVFPGHTTDFNSSCWMYNGKELPFVPVNDKAVPFLRQRNLRKTFEAMLEDSVSEAKALISVENINGPILLLSATRDEICPSTPMAGKIISRLKDQRFKHEYEHIAIVGGHSAPLKHMDSIFLFLEKNFPAR